MFSKVGKLSESFRKGKLWRRQLLNSLSAIVNSEPERSGLKRKFWLPNLMTDVCRTLRRSLLGDLLCENLEDVEEVVTKIFKFKININFALDSLKAEFHVERQNLDGSAREKFIIIRPIHQDCVIGPNLVNVISSYLAWAAFH